MKNGKIISTLLAALALSMLVQVDSAQAGRRRMVINNVDMQRIYDYGRIKNVYWPRGSGVMYLYSTRPWFGALLDVDGDGQYTDTVVVNQKAKEMKAGYYDPSDGEVKWADAWSSLKDNLTPDDYDLANWPDPFMVDGAPDLKGDQDIVVMSQDVTSEVYEETPLKLGIQYLYHFWAFKRDAASDFIFLEGTAINQSANMVNTTSPGQTGPCVWKNCYFGQRLDPDVGSNCNDDRSGFMKANNLGFTFDRDFTDGGKPIGFMGVRVLATPIINGQELGLSNWTSIQNASSAYIVPDPTDDKTQYRILSAAPGQVLDPPYDPTKDFQFSGVTGDTRQIIASGAFDMQPGDQQSMTLGFCFAMAKDANVTAYETDEEVIAQLGNLVEVSEAVKLFYDLGSMAKGAPTPGITLIPSDGKVTITWDAADFSSPNIEIAEYRIYRSFNASGQTADGEPSYQLMGTYSHEDNKSYSIVDNAEELINGWNVYYAITVADRLSGQLAEILGAGLQVGEPTFAIANSTIPRTDALGLGQQGVLKIRVVPNPFYVHASWDTAPTEKHVQFINLPAACTIRIFTLSGNLVNVVQHTNGSGTENYNLLNRFGEPLASGVYYWVVTDRGGDSETGKFIVVQ
ncbi:MAG: T9SS type A sorting domain-containing protein [Gemmatimonadota bacterium]|nr:T9SS type A sorting domain-containing protein [Gemmatimonadota bacterium]